MRSAVVLVLLAGCGRVGFAPPGGDAPPGDAIDDLCTWGEIDALGDLDTPSDDSEPALAPNGQKVVFSSRRLGADARLFFSTPAGNGWSDPSLLPNVDGGGPGEFGPAWNAAGTKLYFTSFRAGPLGLYVSSYSNATFSAPALVPGLETQSELASPTVTGDELEMYVTTRLPPHRIRYANRGTASEPWTFQGDVPELAALELGYPGITTDGLTLYFERYYPGGRFQIERVVRATRDASWSAPAVVAELVGANNAGDPQPSADGTQLLFSSDRDTAGDFDIYIVDRACP